MKGFLLDTSALLTLRDNEPGAARVGPLLKDAHGGGLPCQGCFMSLLEVFYRVWKDIVAGLWGWDDALFGEFRNIFFFVSFNQKSNNFHQRSQGVRFIFPYFVN